MTTKTQTVPPGCHVREHAHDRVEELIFVLAGTGRAVLDGENVAMVPSPRQRTRKRPR